MIWLCGSLVYADIPTLEKHDHLRQVIGVERQLSVRFIDGTIKDILTFFTDEFGLNIIYNQSDLDLQQTLSFSFKDVHPVDAFNSILSESELDWSFSNNVIHVSNYNRIQIIKLNYVNGVKVMESIGPLIPPTGKLSIDELNNAIILNVPDKYQATILDAIKMLDQPPLQVLVEATIMELQNSDDLIIGTNLFTHLTSAPNVSVQTSGFTNGTATQLPTTTTLPTSGSTLPSGLSVAVLSQDFRLLFEALETKSDIEVLGTPKILATNYQEASIITGERLGFKLTSVTGTTVQETVQFLEVGTKLMFTPVISNNDEILMKIKPEVSDGRIVDGVPQENTTEAETEIFVNDGQTIVIGGLVRNKAVTTHSGVPVLGRLPLIGRLFSKQIVSNQKRELVVLLKPTIVR